jgi:N-dimethylarginine dimethylaminohydrolase
MVSDDMQSSTTQSDVVQTQSQTETQTQTQTMTGDLVCVLVCSPRNAGWNQPDKAAAWRDLGFHHPLDFPVAQSQHDRLCQLLADAGADVIELAPSDDLTLDAVYTHDASLATSDGLILMNPGKRSRFAETRRHREQCTKAGISTLGEIQQPGIAEAGDIVWLDPQTLLVGNGYRTNKGGIDQLRAMLAPRGVEVLSAPLPYGPGPSACLHLMSLMSVLDQKTILVDLPWLAVETVELLRARNFRFIEIDDSERDSLACNVLSLGSNRLIALEENERTNQRLRDSGFDIRTFPGSELCLNGSGGPTCLTRPLHRR